MSEMTDPTAGERCICGPFQPPHNAECPFSSQQTQMAEASGDGWPPAVRTFGTVRIIPDISDPLPAEPDAGDVEHAGSLGRIIWETSRADEATISATGANIVARAILASDWLDAVRRKAGGERAEQIAQAIEAASERWPAGPSRGDYAEAARIARESR